MHSTKFKDRVGQRFTRLLVVAKAEPAYSGKGYPVTRWVCQCDCGNTAVVRATRLADGIKSCGCQNVEASTERCTKHGLHKSREYGIWGGMKGRCYNPKNAAFAGYGAKGITVCDRWRNSFENFFADMGICPEGMSIDRIDGTKGYFSENCRWATDGEQIRNRRVTRWFTHNGKTLCLKDWARQVGMSGCTLSARLTKGWSVERALTEPPDARMQRFPLPHLEGTK